MSIQNIFVVEPRLWTMEGHEFEHVVEFAKGIKYSYPDKKVTILTGTQDDTLKNALKNEESIDFSYECFPRRMISDSSSPIYLLKSSLKDAFVLCHALREYADSKSVTLLFSSLALHQFLMLAFLRFFMPFWQIKAMGVFRYDPIDPKGRLRTKYRFLLNTFPANLLWRLAIRDTKISVDSHILQSILHQHFKIESGLAPIPIPGVWKTEKNNPYLLKSKFDNLPLTIGYIGQPRPSRGFDLFVVAAIAMEKERIAGKVKFKAVIPPDGDKFWNTQLFADILRFDMVGISLEERLMDSDDFALQMSQVDIVWALGDPAIYRRQTSGVVTHAVCLGRKLITNRAGWAEDLLGSSQNIRFVDVSLIEVISALRFLCFEQDRQYDNTYKDVSPNISQLWRESNSQQAFYQWIYKNIT